MLGSSFLVLAVALGPAEAPVSPTRDAAGPSAARTRLDRGFLRVQGHERAPLLEALALRVPHLSFEPFEAARSGALGQAAFIDLRRQADVGDDDGAMGFTLTIVVSDGRAFDRRVTARRGDEEITRLLASTAANLLLAIEAGTVEADRGDVPLPTPRCPTRECPTPRCPAPAPSSSEAETSASSPTAERRAARLELGPVVALGSGLGLGSPAEADRFVGLGGTVGLQARLRRGASFGAEVRGAGRDSLGGIGLARLRVAAGAGYRWRRERWSLGASLWGTVEPWWVRGGRIEPAPSPQWGLALRLSPALRVPGLAGDRLALAVGPTIELAVSGAPTGDGLGVGRVTIERGGERLADVRVGGLELWTGVSATLWFDPSGS